jgi:prophage antirepressor-like protein
VSQLKLHPALFQGKPVHTLTVDGRPAWVAREVGATIGYANHGKRFVGCITDEWSDDFVAGVDYALLTGADLAAIKADVDAVSPHAKGVLVLFESGLHMALLKTHMPLGRALRRFLVDEVLPRLVRNEAPAPAPPEPPRDVALLRELRLAARVDLDDRKFRSEQLRRTADLLYLCHRLDGRTWSLCAISAAEIALGRTLRSLYPPPAPTFTPVEVVAVELGVEDHVVLEAAQRLGLLFQPDRARPVPVHHEGVWDVAFEFTSEAIDQIEAWIAETRDEAEEPTQEAA